MCSGWVHELDSPKALEWRYNDRVTGIYAGPKTQALASNISMDVATPKGYNWNSLSRNRLIIHVSPVGRVNVITQAFFATPTVNHASWSSLAKFDSFTVKESNQPMRSKICECWLVNYQILTDYYIVYNTMILYYNVAKSKGFNSKQKYQGRTHWYMCISSWYS